MKLLTILLLTALPFLCYAGSGCGLIENVVNWTTDSSISPDGYADLLKAYTPSEEAAKALMDLKTCFNTQNETILELVRELMNTIYQSKWCALY